MSARDRFIEAALVFCLQDGIVRNSRGGKCTEESKGNAHGEGYQAPCWQESEDPERMCEACQKRVSDRPTYNKAIQARSAAKRRMLKWADRMTAERAA